jgi:ABC-type nitrate/sulfonate/bicarbonate transport system substrate-binding protein
MVELDRRHFMKRAGLVTAGVASVGGLSAFLAACGGGDGAQAASDGKPAGVIASPKMGITSSLLPTYLPQIGGPVLYGKPYGLDVTKDNFTIFDSTSTLSQSTLSGQTVLAGQSTMAQLLLIEQGLPFKIFGTYILTDDIVMAARNGIKSVADIKKPGVVVATDSPGGSSRTIFDALLQANGADFLVSSLPDVAVIESGGERMSALASGDAHVACLHLSQANQVQAEKGDVTIIGRLYSQVPSYLKDSWVAKTDWLEQNQATAAAIVASTIAASRALKVDQAKFTAAVKQLVDEPPPDKDIAEVFPIIRDNDVWPVDGGLTDERIQYMIDLGRKEGILTTDLKAADVLDKRPMEAALKLIGNQ